MKTYLYLSTAIISVSLATSGNAWAQCVSTQDCATLGYTETSCPNGGVKCPFGNKWICINSGITPEQCTELGFTQTCTGTGYTGAGKDCNGKYYECTCASGYEWKDGSCQKQVLNGAQGNLYYCNGTVVGVKASSMNFYVALKDVGGQSCWSNASSSCNSYSFCGYLKGTLPSQGQLLTMYSNQSTINDLLRANGGSSLTTSGAYWSSTAGGSKYYIVYMSTGGTINNYMSEYQCSFYARPILSSY